MFTNIKNNIKKHGPAATAFGLFAAPAFAQSTTPVDTVTGASSTAQTAWAAFAAISASAFVFAMVIKYGRKGTK
jgi:hypothetical protein